MKSIEIAVRLLEDTKQYLVHLPPHLYALPQELLFNASVGQHTRHFIEFFQCLIVQARSEHRIINYAERDRDPVIEKNPEVALRVVDNIIEELNATKDNVPCTIECSEHLQDQSNYPVATSFERELIYNIEHTIHHLAIIKIGIKAIAPSFELPEYFGVAPSTVKYKEASCAQ